MGAIEYRVVWQRQGTPRVKERRYLTGRGALRRYALLTSPPHARCTPGNGYDEPPFCVWSRGYEHEEPPPWLVEPRIEVRGVGPWDPMTDDRPHDPRALPDEAVSALAETLATTVGGGTTAAHWRVTAQIVHGHLAAAGWHLSRHAPDGAADGVDRMAHALHRYMHERLPNERLCCQPLDLYPERIEFWRKEARRLLGIAP